MENIHNKYKYFDWYAAFIVELFRFNNKPYFSVRSTLINAFIWKSTVQGHNYWGRIHKSLMDADYRLSEAETRILRQDALDFYKPVYEKLKLIHPELFI